VIDGWLADCRECVAFLKKNPGFKPTGDAAVYGAAGVLPGEVLGEVTAL
jgi:hypothetical protein